ncbi:MAG: DUF2905 domain-containing protein [Chloroflexi bacterium]|nr:DUF2905 domain-containing protein [Chloroflexota bacterium]
METSARLIILAGIVLIIIGAIVYALAKLNLPLGRLPGDIRIEGRGGSFYLPLTTSILISIVLSVLVNIIGHFWKK